MSEAKQFDIIIVGGGLSGLSLAVELHRQGLLENKKLLILEKRSTYVDDKSWCGWNVLPHGFSQCVGKTWDEWEVGYKGKHILRTSKQYQYQYINSKSFYDYCLNYIRQSAQIQLKLNTVITQMNDHEVTCDNLHYKSDLIFDARAAHIDFDILKPKDNYLLQAFYGFKIKTPKPVFKPDTLILMDFCSSQTKGINFIYLLPFTEDEALIEPTYFLHHPDIPNKAHFFQLAKEYLKKRFACDNFEVLHEEKGILPMQPWQKNNFQYDKKGIGSAHGLIRPATGYAFSGIQRNIHAIIASMKAQLPLKVHTYSKMSAWMDSLFLQVCRKNHRDADKLFYGLFEHANSDALVRFMHDNATLQDYLKVMLAMPKARFLKTAMTRHLRLWS